MQCTEKTPLKASTTKKTKTKSFIEPKTTLDGGVDDNLSEVERK